MGFAGWIASILGKGSAQNRKFSSFAELRAAVLEALPKYCEEVENVVEDARDPAVFSARINGKEQTGDVSNLYGYLSSYVDLETNEQIEKYVRAFNGKRVVNRDNIIFTLRTKDYIDYIDKQFHNAIAEPFLGELNKFYMIDLPDSLSHLKRDEMPISSVSELSVLALGNIQKWLPNIEINQSIRPILLYTLKDNPLLISSMLVLDEFWVSIEQAVGPDVYFAIPRRDQLFILDATNSDVVPTLRKVVEYTFQANFALLSHGIYRRRNGKLEVVSA